MMLSEGFLVPATMARSVFTAVAYAHSVCRVSINHVLLYAQVFSSPKPYFCFADSALCTPSTRSLELTVHGWHGSFTSSSDAAAGPAIFVIPPNIERERSVVPALAYMAVIDQCDCLSQVIIVFPQQWPASRVSIISDRSFDSFGSTMCEAICSQAVPAPRFMHFVRNLQAGVHRARAFCRTFCLAMRCFSCV
jgi:hypothetical protein